MHRETFRVEDGHHVCISPDTRDKLHRLTQARTESPILVFFRENAEVLRPLGTLAVPFKETIV
jgi:hypothetical protein